MDGLSRRIGKRLDEHKFCTVFENDLARVWPYTDKERERRFAQIRAFAKANGWSATILDPGIRVTFRRLPSGKPEAVMTPAGPKSIR